MSNQIPAANRDVTASDNERAGDKIDYAKMETERLKAEYGHLETKFGRLSAEAEAVEDVPDDETSLKLGGTIKALRDLRSLMENTRKVEAEPWLRRKNADDAYFGFYIEAIQPEDKRQRLNRPGVIDRAQTKINAHLDRKEALIRAEAERVRAEEQRKAADALKAAQKAAEEARQAERDAQDARDRIERARNAESRIARQAEADAAAKAAAEKAALAKSTEVAANTADERRQDAHIATLASSADVVRMKGNTAEGGGVTQTKATEKFAYVTDRSMIDEKTRALLFTYLNDAEVEKCVRSFANKTNYGMELPGCAIGTRKTGVTR